MYCIILLSGKTLGAYLSIIREDGIMRKSNGSVLILAIAFIVILSFIAHGVLVLIPTNYMSSVKIKEKTQVQYALDAGLQEGIQYLRSATIKGTPSPSKIIADKNKPQITGSIGNNKYQYKTYIQYLSPNIDTAQVQTQFAANGIFAFSVSVTEGDPYVNTGTTPNATLNKYALQVETENHRLFAIIQEDSFAKYAFFSDKETVNLSKLEKLNGGPFPDEEKPALWAHESRVKGPVHSNGRLYFGLRKATGGTYYYDGLFRPIFKAEVTSAYSDGTQDSNCYISGSSDPCNENKEITPYDPTPDNPIPKRYLEIFKDGRSALNTGVKIIDLKADRSPLGNIAYTGSKNSSDPLPAVEGIHLLTSLGKSGSTYIGKPLGGIYIYGDVDKIDLLGKSIKITQHDNYWILTESINNISLKYRLCNGCPPTTIYEYSGNEKLNGLLHVEGEIKSLSGTISGRKTISASGDIVITNNIKYQNSDSDMLGIIGNNVVVRTETFSPNDITINDITIEGAIMAVNNDALTGKISGSFYAAQAATQNLGTIRVSGAIIQGNSGIVAIGGKGYSKKYEYDPRLALTPPPYFPITNKFKIIYKEEL